MNYPELIFLTVRHLPDLPNHPPSYIKNSSDALVTSKYETEDGFPLGRWVNARRSEKETMTKERKKRLDAIGFVWRVI